MAIRLPYTRSNIMNAGQCVYAVNDGNIVATRLIGRLPTLRSQWITDIDQNPVDQSCLHVHRAEAEVALRERQGDMDREGDRG